MFLNLPVFYMKRQLLLILLLLTCVELRAKSFSLGAGTGASLYQRDLTDYWKDAALWGVDFSYPITRRVPVTLSIYGSVHKHRNLFNEIIPPHPAAVKVLFINVDLAFEYALWQQRPVSPLWSLGFTSTTMVAYKEWPPQNNDDESEIGITGNGGIRVRPNPNISFDVLYKQYMLFTEPRYLSFGSLLCRFIITIERGRKNEK